MSLLFLRHAETDLADTFCGHSDPPLNSRGHAQAARLAQQLAAHPFDAIYSSDLQRAVQTAAYLPCPIHDGLTVMSGKNHLTLRPALREIHFGDWESLTWPQIEARDPLYARRWADNFPHLPAPNGESFAHFESRVLKELSVILSEVRRQPDAVEGPARPDAPERPPERFSHPIPQHNPRIAVVTHAGVLRLILRELFGLAEAEAWQQTKPYCCTFPYPSSETRSPTSPHPPRIHVTMKDTTGATP